MANQVEPPPEPRPDPGRALPDKDGGWIVKTRDGRILGQGRTFMAARLDAQRQKEKP